MAPGRYWRTRAIDASLLQPHVLYMVATKVPVRPLPWAQCTKILLDCSVFVSCGIKRRHCAVTAAEGTPKSTTGNWCHWIPCKPKWCERFLAPKRCSSMVSSKLTTVLIPCASSSAISAANGLSPARSARVFPGHADIPISPFQGVGAKSMVSAVGSGVFTVQL